MENIENSLIPGHFLIRIEEKLMVSSVEQLKKRGYVSDEDMDEYLNYSNNELMELLESKEPMKRTAAIRILAHTNHIDRELTKLLCNMLISEKKLYTKLELCTALSKATPESIEIMVGFLGMIGDNQYKELPDQIFEKKSYPLPRDIIARTLAHMSIDILPGLILILKSDQITVVREVIDSIGFLCFYNQPFNSEIVINELMILLNNTNDDIIRWKIVRAFESFHSNVVIEKLHEIKNHDENEKIRLEAQRSINILNNRVSPNKFIKSSQH